jgi:hypothetical protein
MWIVAKYKMNEINSLKKSFREILGNDPEYYFPKIKYNQIIKRQFKIVKKSILEDYLICFHPQFKNTNVLNILKFARGLKCILEGFKNNQNEISRFINRCKKFEDEKGYLKQDFFNKGNFVRGKFTSGPFTNLVFDVLSREVDKIEILIGKYKTTLIKNSDFLYRPI